MSVNEGMSQHLSGAQTTTVDKTKRGRRRNRTNQKVFLISSIVVAMAVTLHLLQSSKCDHFDVAKLSLFRSLSCSEHCVPFSGFFSFVSCHSHRVVLHFAVCLLGSSLGVRPSFVVVRI